MSLGGVAAERVRLGPARRDAATINRYFVLFLVAAVVFGAFAALRYYLVSWLG